jgi:hypothetical protein
MNQAALSKDKEKILRNPSLREMSPLDLGDLVSPNLPQISRGQAPIRKAKVAGPHACDGQLETCQPRYFVTQL